MPLDKLQELVARTALHLDEATTLALAGGAAMIVHGFVDRTTHDIDMFTEVDDDEAVRVARALRSALEDCGLKTANATRPPLDHRFIVHAADGQECTVEVFADGGRLHHRVMLDIGAVLHPDDLAADKVLALWGRARPRDFYDVNALVQRYGRAALLRLAAAKDHGFTIATFVDALNAIRRLGPEDWTEDGVDLADVEVLREVFHQWREELQIEQQKKAEGD